MTTAKRPPAKIGLIILAYIAFVALGMPDGLNGVGWPSIRAGFNIPLDALGMLLFSSTIGYLTSSFVSGKLIGVMSIGGLLAASCGLTGVALIGYTLVPQWWMMVGLGIFTGLGAGAIDAGLNVYVAENFSEGLMQWLHACYGIGITLGPIIMTMSITNFDSWRLGYQIVGAFQLILALCFVLTLRSWKHKASPIDQNGEKKITEYKTSYRETFARPEVWMSMLLFAFYVGAEFAMGSWAYTLLTQSRGIAPKVAGFWAGSYYGLFTIGRILAGLYSKRLSVNTIVQISLAGALTGSLLVLLNLSPVLSLVGVVIIGFSIAPVFPALMSGTSDRVSPKYTANTIGMQMAASGIGGALIPSLVGILARRVNIEIIPLCWIILFGLMFGLYELSMRRTSQLQQQRENENPQAA